MRPFRLRKIGAWGSVSRAKMMRPPATTSVQRHYDYLDGIRAVLALYVMGHHAWYTAHDRDPAGISPWFYFLAHGYFAVVFFIVLSGFCLTLPLLKTNFSLPDGAGRFFQRRAWRILPPYYFALFLSLALIYAFIHERTGTRWDWSLPVTWYNFIVHMLLVQNLVPGTGSKINYVLWSISLEWQIYFYFPLMLWCWRKIGPMGTVVGVLVLSKVAEVVFDEFVEVQSSISFTGFFALGMFACYASYSTEEASAKFRKVWWGWIAAIFGLMFLVLLPREHRPGIELVFACFAASSLIFLSLNPAGWLHRALDFKPLVFVGGFSYSLYLIHAPLLQMIWQYVLRPWQVETNLMCVLLLIFGGALCVLISYVFYLGCERPFLKKKGRAIVHVK